MSEINYDGRQFVGVANTENGEVSGQTVFHYRQRGVSTTGDLNRYDAQSKFSRSAQPWLIHPQKLQQVAPHCSSTL